MSDTIRAKLERAQKVLAASTEVPLDTANDKALRVWVLNSNTALRDITEALTELSELERDHEAMEKLRGYVTNPADAILGSKGAA